MLPEFLYLFLHKNVEIQLEHELKNCKMLQNSENKKLYFSRFFRHFGSYVEKEKI